MTKLFAGPSYCVNITLFIVSSVVSSQIDTNGPQWPKRALGHVRLTKIQIRLYYTIGIEHGFSCINVRQVPRKVLKTEAGGRGFQHLPRDLAYVNALKNYVRLQLLHKKWKQFLHFALFLVLFCFAFHRCLANAIPADYARSRAGHYTSRDGSSSVAPVQAYWKLRSRALTARELPC